MKLNLTILFIAVILILPTTVAAAALTQSQLQEDFNFFWDSYKEAYVFFELKGAEFGVNWDQMKEEYTDTVNHLTSKRELMRLIAEMQARLHDGHCGNKGLTAIGPVSLIRGISFTNTTGDRIHVKQVAENSIFDQKGVSAGDEVKIFKGKTIPALKREGRTLFAASSEGQFNRSFASMLHVYHPYLGTPPATCVCSFEKADGTIIDIETNWDIFNPEPALAPTKSATAAKSIIEIDASGPLPMKAILFKEQNVGYVKLESFMKTEDPTEQFNNIFGALSDTKALILDLRDNGGGVGPWGILLADYFIDSSELPTNPNESYMERNYSRTFFKLILKQASAEELENFFKDPATVHYILGRLGVDMTIEEVNAQFVDGEYTPFYHKMALTDKKPGIAPYTKPVIALTNGGCYSTTDICLTIMDEYNRVITVGTPNGAGSGSPIAMTLPNSKIEVMVPHARAYPPSGRMIEGHPLEVDVIVETTPEDLMTGTDRHLVTALSLIERKTATKLNLPATRFNPVLSINPSELRPVTLYDTTDPVESKEISVLIPDSVREAQLTKTAPISIKDVRAVHNR